MSAGLSEQELIDQLKAIDWFQFEKLVGLLYEEAGYSVERKGGAKADGGVDLVVSKPPNERGVVQCKHWRNWRVSVKDIRELVGAMAAIGIDQGVCVTLRGYTEDARDLAAQQGIFLYDETNLIQMLKTSRGETIPRLAQFLSDPRKHCPKCEREMTLRTAKKGANAGKKFWGCSGYPKCSFIFKISEEEQKHCVERQQPSQAKIDEALDAAERVLKAINELR
jgi:restriction system protein